MGNPNVGKSSLFNELTGLNQKVGNFPGVTLEKKTGTLKLSEQKKAEIIDLPGIYSLFVKNEEEKVVLNVLLNEKDQHFPDKIIFIIDALNIERSLMLYTQVEDLGFELIPVMTMHDLAVVQGKKIDVGILSKNLNKDIIVINPKKGIGTKALKAYLDSDQKIENLRVNDDFLKKAKQTQFELFDFLADKEKIEFSEAQKNSHLDKTDIQLDDTIQRMNKVYKLIEGAIIESPNPQKSRTEKFDKILTHPFWGYIIYFGVLLLIFQFLFSIAAYPMDWIDAAFSNLNSSLKTILPAGAFSDLITEGIVTGIGGVVIFVPQIAILFAFIAILEESGYMSRVVFLMDKPMRAFGLSGKSIVPLLSGAACAVPAIMSAKGIENSKERLITIFVTPFISCSARLPVYVIIIALVIPDSYVLGLSLKGLTLLALYLSGIIAALFTSVILSKFLKGPEKNLFVMDMPVYRLPRFKNAFTVVFQKTKTFVLEAGKIILAISVILWALASYGPDKAMLEANLKTKQILEKSPELDSAQVLAAQKLEASYIGQFGQLLEPAIRPLGYDWKIGIALITSFAAREVFVGTLGTIYSVGEENFEEKLVVRMKKETFAENGKPVYSFATGISILIFYAFALQCLSTVAIVKRETNGWKWPLIQLAYMTGIAYLLAMISFQLLQ